MVEALYEVANYTLHHSPINEAEYFSHLRYTLEPYIYHYLIQEHMPVFNETWKMKPINVNASIKDAQNLKDSAHRKPSLQSIPDIFSYRPRFVPY